MLNNIAFSVVIGRPFCEGLSFAKVVIKARHKASPTGWGFLFLLAKVYPSLGLFNARHKASPTGWGFLFLLAKINPSLGLFNVRHKDSPAGWDFCFCWRRLILRWGCLT
ncbi:hypothetical protein PALB_24020 [Pseudoalteromonas luteoviolacea B = ATCC 29581]|nr:hypothetical protein PALB_24020 [Pseudoalteromonas luteoviolacea B = ATCC 29581]